MPPFSVRPAPGRRRGAFRKLSGPVWPRFTDQGPQGGGEKPLTVTDAPREEEKMHPISLLRPLAVNCFMCDPSDLAAMQPEIRKFMPVQLRQFADRTSVHAIPCKTPCRIAQRGGDSVTQLHTFAKNMQRRKLCMFRRPIALAECRTKRSTDIIAKSGALTDYVHGRAV